MCEITQPRPSTKYVHFLPPFLPTFHAVALASAEKTAISLTNISAIFKGCSVGAQRKVHSLCQKNEQRSLAPLSCACRSEAESGPWPRPCAQPAFRRGSWEAHHLSWAKLTSPWLLPKHSVGRSFYLLRFTEEASLSSFGQDASCYLTSREGEPPAMKLTW